MDCEKTNNLQVTADSEPLLADSFLIEGQISDVYVSPQQITIIQKAKKTVIPIQFGLSFGLIQGEDSQPQGLQLYCGDEKIRLERNFWPRALQWENELLKHMIRANFHSFFKPIRKIGKGNFASVYLAEDTRMKRKTAVKAFMKQVVIKGQSRASLQNEIKIMRKLKHPNLIQFYGAYQSKNSVYLSIQYAEGITLQSFIRKNPKITSEQRCKIMRGLLLGIKQLSRLKIVHRDIKPENIIISPDCQTLKILDFGLATHINQANYIFIRCGTPGFVAPQILRIKDLQKARLGIQSDIFSLGAIYYQLIYGSPLFQGKSHAEVLFLNRQAKIKLVYKQNLGFEELHLLQGMLQIEPSLRITPQKALKSVLFLERSDIFCRALKPIQSRSDQVIL